VAQAMAARPDRCLGNFLPSPPLTATRPYPMPSPSQLSPHPALVSVVPSSPPSLSSPKPFSLLPRCATPLGVSPPPFAELNPGERRSLAVAPHHAGRSVLRICLQWRCATPIIPRVLHLRTASCNSADGNDAMTTTATTRFFGEFLL